VTELIKKDRAKLQ